MTPDPIPTQDNPEARSTAGMTTKVVKGSIWTLVGQVLPLGASLVTTPFTIRLLGAEGYGVLIFVGLIPTYLGFADFGMSVASTKFGSEAYAEGDAEKEGRIVRTAALIAILTSMPVAALIMIFAASIVGVFNVPANYKADAILALRFASITFVVNFLCSIFNTPQLARLRMDLNTLVGAVPRIIGLIATPVVVFLGFGVVGAIAVLLISSLVTLGGHLFVSRRLLPHLFGPTIDRQNIHILIKFGGAVALSSVAALLLLHLEKIVLAKVTTVETLAYYSIAFTIASMTTMLGSAIIQSLIPAFAQLVSPDKRAQLNSLFERALRINIIVTIPVLVILNVFADSIFTVWAGDDFGRESTPSFRILLIGIFCFILTFIPYSVILASGRSTVLAILYWAELFPYIFLIAILTFNFGARGAAIAWSIRALADAIVMFILAVKTAGLSFNNFGKGPATILVPLLLAAPVAVTATNGQHQIVNIVVLIVSLGLYSLFTWKRLLDSDEKLWFKIRLGKLFNKWYA